MYVDTWIRLAPAQPGGIDCRPRAHALTRKPPVVRVIPLAQAGITPDPHNARLHTPRHVGVIEDSMHTDDAGRSILVDQHGVTIAGAGAWEAATQAGIRRAAVIETDGDTLVIVKRTVTPEQRIRLALADNCATDLVGVGCGSAETLQTQPGRSRDVAQQRNERTGGHQQCRPGRARRAVLGAMSSAALSHRVPTRLVLPVVIAA